MITKITEPTFKTGDGQKFENLALAQEHELELLLTDNQLPDEVRRNICKTLVAESDRVLDILSTRANSRPKARAVNGATRKKRTPKATETAANLALK